jgi:hypothetical protein
LPILDISAASASVPFLTSGTEPFSEGTSSKESLWVGLPATDMAFGMYGVSDRSDEEESRNKTWVLWLSNEF